MYYKYSWVCTLISQAVTVKLKKKTQIVGQLLCVWGLHGLHRKQRFCLAEASSPARALNQVLGSSSGKH